MNKKILSESHSVSPFFQLLKNGKATIPISINLWDLADKISQKADTRSSGVNTYIQVQDHEEEDVLEIRDRDLLTRRTIYMLLSDRSPINRPKFDHPEFQSFLDKILLLLPKSMEFGECALMDTYVAPHSTKKELPFHRDGDTDVIVILWASTPNLTGGELGLSRLPDTLVKEAQTKKISLPSNPDRIELYPPQTTTDTLIFDNGVNMHKVNTITNDSDSVGHRLSLTLTFRVKGQQKSSYNEDTQTQIEFHRYALEQKLSEFDSKCHL